MATSYTLSEQKVLKKIGTKIRGFRNDIELSQEEFARKCDLDRTYISDVERGERNVSILNLIKIAKSLKVSPAELLEI